MRRGAGEEAAPRASQRSVQPKRVLSEATGAKGTIGRQRQGFCSVSGARSAKAAPNETSEANTMSRSSAQRPSRRNLRAGCRMEDRRRKPAVGRRGASLGTLGALGSADEAADDAQAVPTSLQIQPPAPKHAGNEP